MDTVIHSAVVNGEFTNQEVQREFTDEGRFREYCRELLDQPMMRFNASLFQAKQAATPGVTFALEANFVTSFYTNKKYDSVFLTINNSVNSIVFYPKISTNKLPARLGGTVVGDNISSIKVGAWVDCVLCTQHTYFRGDRLWLIGGQQSNKPDLSQIRWENPISAVAAATLESTITSPPIHALGQRLGLFN